MVDEKLQHKLWRHCPPFVITVFLSVFVVSDSVKWHDWPILGEFLMTPSLMAVIIALIWGVVFFSWGFWLDRSPRFYRDQVYQDMREVREKLLKLNEFYNDTMPFYHLYEELKPYSSKIPTRHLEDFAEICRLAQNCQFFHEDQKILREESEIIEHSPTLPILVKKIISFQRKTAWVLKK